MAEDLGYDTDFPSVGEDSKPDSPPSPISTALSPSSPPSSPSSQPSTPPRLTLAASPSSRSSTPASLDLEYPPPPRSPCAFIWRCHLCGARYPLGATRRCLTDGHYYCYGQDTDKNIKRKRRGKSCTSIFDYQGWDDWNEWRRETRDLNFLWGKEDDSPTPGTHSNCWDNCHFPSACRYLDTIQGETYGGASFLDVCTISAIHHKTNFHLSSFLVNYQRYSDLLTYSRGTYSAGNSPRKGNARNFMTRLKE